MQADGTHDGGDELRLEILRQRQRVRMNVHIYANESRMRQGEEKDVARRQQRDREQNDDNVEIVELHVNRKKRAHRQNSRGQSNLRADHHDEARERRFAGPVDKQGDESRQRGEDDGHRRNRRHEERGRKEKNHRDQKEKGYHAQQARSAIRLAPDEACVDGRAFRRGPAIPPADQAALPLLRFLLNHFGRSPRSL